MDHKFTPFIGAASLVILLGILFGFAGFSLGIFIAVSTASAALILIKLGFDELFAVALGLPASIIFHSSVAYGLGFLFGLTAGMYLSVVLLALAAAALWFMPSIKLKKKAHVSQP